MKRILTCLLSIILIITSVPVVSMAQTTEQEKAIDITEELTTAEQFLVENNELGFGIYFNEKCRSFFEDKLTDKSVFSINQDGFLELNFFDDLVSKNDYDKIINYNTYDLSLIISINQNPFTLKEQNDSDYYIIDSVNDITDIAVFNTEKAVDFDEEMFYSYLIEIIDILEEKHKTDTTESENNDENSDDKDSDTELDTSVSITDEEITDKNNHSDTNIEEETTNIETPPTENSDENGTDDVLINTSYINLSSETFSEIISFAFPLGNYQEEINSIYVSNDIKDTICSALETWYNNEYCLSNNEIKINESLILNSANNKSLENGIKYIFLGQDNDGNLLSVKLSDNINKNNGVLQLMNSNYSTLIVSYNQLLQNDIEINSDEYFCLMYCDDQLLIAVNTEKCEQNSIGAKESFNSIINAFLNEYRIESIQLFGIAVGNPVVYSGPGKNGYAAVGSLNPFDSYETIYKELGFQYIEYTVDGTNTKKRGYIDQYGGGSGTIPYSYGVGGKIKNGCTVYSGPSSSYATVGSVSSGEFVTLLTQARPTSQTVYWYLEYSTSNGTKRGYVLSSNINTIPNTGFGVTLNNITVYDEYIVESGSLYKNEYFVITGYNDNYYKIEYNSAATAGRKTGYVRKSEVHSINSDATIPKVANSSAIHAVPKQSTSVYGGPSSSIYANIGSVDSSDTVGVLGKEGSYYYIQYSTSSGSKRGYIQMSALSSFSGSSSIKSTGVENATAYADAPSAACTVYSCPDVNSATIGSIGAYEGITVFTDIKDRGFTFIEYSTAANTKRGFISSSLLRRYNDGVKGTAKTDVNIYYTPNDNFKLGSIYVGEYVIALGKIDNCYYIEYNSPSGRKRGYVKNTNIALSSSSVPNITEADQSVQMKSAEKVYSGPSVTYANIGSVDKNEPATLINTGDRGWYQIEYNTSLGFKRGYVPKSSADIVERPHYSEIYYRTYTYAEKHTMDGYTSGLGKPLIYYTIGDKNSDNILFLNFAIHGHEDKYAQDGMELVNMAFRTLSVLDANYNKISSNNWYIIIIPTFNPDGLLDGDNCKEGALCNGPGRHNAVQMKRNNDGTWSKYTSGLGHIDMNRCFPYNSTGGFTQQTSARNYTGPEAMMAKEAYALSELINTFKNKSGTKYFIDVHGWTQQIIFAGDRENSPFVKAFYEHGFKSNSRDATLDGNGARGYVARYALELGYQACLFEFPDDTIATNFNNGKYEDYFINSIKYLIEI